MNGSLTRTIAAAVLATGLTAASGAAPAAHARLLTLEESGGTVQQYVNRVDYDRSSLVVSGSTLGQYLNWYDFARPGR